MLAMQGRKYLLLHPKYSCKAELPEEAAVLVHGMAARKHTIVAGSPSAKPYFKKQQAPGDHISDGECALGVPARRRGCQLLRFLGNQIGHLGQHVAAGRFKDPEEFHAFFFTRFQGFIYDTRDLLDKHGLEIALTSMLPARTKPLSIRTLASASVGAAWRRATSPRGSSSPRAPSMRSISTSF